MSEQPKATEGTVDANQDEPYCLPRDLCPCLFTKTMSLNTEHRLHPLEEQLFTGDTAIFECTRTMSQFGLDEDDANPEKCVPGRMCYGGDVPTNDAPDPNIT